MATDDAFITYRYSRNWAQGNGLVFNPGERVEGYTNLLYTLLMGLPFAAGWDVLTFSLGFNTLCTLATAVLFFSFVRKQLTPALALVSGLLFALAPSLWLWTSSGLETPLVLLLQVAIWLSVERVQERSSPANLALLLAPIGLLVLTRADGFVTAFIVASYFVLKRDFRKAALVGAVTVFVHGDVIAWRLAYYHDVLPNTYYAKVSATLPERLRAAVKELGGIAARQGHAAYLLTLGACWLAIAKQSRRDGIARTLSDLPYDLFFAASWLAYWLYVGGDNFEDRFLIVLIPIGIYRLSKHFLAAATPAIRNLAIAMVAVMQLAVPVRDPQYGKSFVPKYDCWVTLGQFLKERVPGRTIAISAAGKVPFFSELKAIDTLGLNDRHIGRLKPMFGAVGHAKCDPDYVLARQPELIAGYFQGDGLGMDACMDEEKYRPKGFAVRYLLNTMHESREGENVIDVKNKSRSEVLTLIHRGWRFGVLERSSLAYGTSAQASGVAR